MNFLAKFSFMLFHLIVTLEFGPCDLMSHILLPSLLSFFERERPHIICVVTRLSNDASQRVMGRVQNTRSPSIASGPFPSKSPASYTLCVYGLSLSRVGATKIHMFLSNVMILKFASHDVGDPSTSIFFLSFYPLFSFLVSVCVFY
jgi:hypothetical protein